MGRGGRWGSETRSGREKWDGSGVEREGRVVLRGAVDALKRVCYGGKVLGIRRAKEKDML